MIHRLTNKFDSGNYPNLCQVGDNPVQNFAKRYSECIFSLVDDTVKELFSSKEQFTTSKSHRGTERVIKLVYRQYTGIPLMADYQCCA